MTVRLIHGDCLEVLPTLEAGSIDVVITDPPYGVNKADWDSSFPMEWIVPAFDTCQKMLVMVGPSTLPIALKYLPAYKDVICMYSKNGMTLAKIAFGNFFLVLACGDWKWKPRPSLYPYVIDVTEKINHPTPKPKAAMLHLLNNFTQLGNTILDPFMGSGTTGVACVETGRNFIGIEIDADYFAIAQRRIADAESRMNGTARKVDGSTVASLPLFHP